MEDNYVERSLKTIRKEIKDYEGFIRCTNPRHTSAEAESQFNFLKTTQPFAVMEEIQDEKNDFFCLSSIKTYCLMEINARRSPNCSSPR